MAILTLLPVNNASAVGTRLPNQDPEAIARGNAFVATADNPSAIYYNPAGITQLEGEQIRAGIYLISADVKYTSPSGATAQTDSSFQAVPQIYYVCSLTNTPFTLGLGVYSPYGLSLDWGNHAPFSTLAENGKVLYLCGNPVIAWRIHPKFSIAIGPTINYSRADFKQGLGFTPNDSFKFDGDAWAFGFNAGLRWQPDPHWAFGVNYRSATTMDYSGTTRTTPTSPFPPYFPATATSASINFPQFVAAGVSFRPTKDWNLEFDIDWTDWNAVKKIVFTGTPLGNIPFVLNYQSSFMYEFGITRQLGKGYFASVGYIYSENSSPDKNFSPLIPDANLQLGSIGFGHHGRRLDWAVGYHFAYNPGRDVKNDVNPLADGNYKTFNNAINISTTLKF